MIILIKTFEFVYDKGKLRGIVPCHEQWAITNSLPEKV